MGRSEDGLGHLLFERSRRQHDYHFILDALRAQGTDPPQPLQSGEQAFGCILSVPLLRGARGGFMVPMHAKKRMNAIFEPWLVWSPAFRRLEGLDRLKPGLQAVGSFMVPMHAKKGMEAF